MAFGTHVRAFSRGRCVSVRTYKHQQQQRTYVRTYVQTPQVPKCDAHTDMLEHEVAARARREIDFALRVLPDWATQVVGHPAFRRQAAMSFCHCPSQVAMRIFRSYSWILYQRRT